MRRRLLILAASAALGLVLGAVLVVTRTPAAVGYAIAAVPSAVVIPWVIYCRRARRRAPERFRDVVARHFDADAGPPAGSEPVDEPVVRRWYAADARDDWRALAELLTPDFRLHPVAGRRPIRRWVVVRLARNGAKWLGECENELLETLADPCEPDVVWVKEHSVQRLPDGGEMRCANWARWTLSADRERIRAIAVVAYTAPPVPV